MHMHAIYIYLHVCYIYVYKCYIYAIYMLHVHIYIELLRKVLCVISLKD